MFAAVFDSDEFVYVPKKKSYISGYSRDIVPALCPLEEKEIRIDLREGKSR